VIIQLSYVCGCIVYLSGSCCVTLLTVKNFVKDVMHGRGLCKKSSNLVCTSFLLYNVCVGITVVLLQQWNIRYVSYIPALILVIVSLVQREYCYHYFDYC